MTSSSAQATATEATLSDGVAHLDSCSVRGLGSWSRACCRCWLNSCGSWYTRQLPKAEMKWLQGWWAQMTHLPIARASIEVVATTSLVLQFTNTCNRQLPFCYHKARVNMGSKAIRGEWINTIWGKGSRRQVMVVWEKAERQGRRRELADMT